jgi:hypothetical protein
MAISNQHEITRGGDVGPANEDVSTTRFTPASCEARTVATSPARRRSGCLVPMYLGIIRLFEEIPMVEVERVQTGIRIEKRLLKVLKALAELKDLSLGGLLEGIVLHAFEGKMPFSKETLAQIAELRKVYRMPLRAADSHQLKEKPA